jgi:hypothetical protein
MPATTGENTISQDKKCGHLSEKMQSKQSLTEPKASNSDSLVSWRQRRFANK